MVAAGCTGEFWALKLPERAHLAKLTVDACKGRGPAIVGTGSIREGEVIEQIHAAKGGRRGWRAGDATLLRAPDRTPEIIAHYEAIDAASVLPIVLYNIPGNAGNAITPAIADRLADLDNVVAIKESSGNWTNFHDTLMRVKDRIRVYLRAVQSCSAWPATLAGADGLIDCFPNVWDKGCLDLWHATRAGRMDEAWALQRTGLAMTELFTTEGRTLYPATKAAMNFLGLPGGGIPRPAAARADWRAAGGLEGGDGRAAYDAASEGGVMDLGIRGKRAIVTAASKGLGLATARALAREGVDVVMNARTAGPLEEAASAIRAEFGVDAVPVATDVNTSDGRAAILSAAGPVDILVSNPGVRQVPTPYAQITPEDWRHWLEVHFLSSVELIQAVTPGMVERRFGRVVTMSVSFIKFPAGGLCAFPCSKAGAVGRGGRDGAGTHPAQRDDQHRLSRPVRHRRAAHQPARPCRAPGRDL
jgi:dihydrodipicolinate synthase/N-acetylneuraminate lyase